MQKLIKLRQLTVTKCDMLQGEGVGWPCWKRFEVIINALMRI
jgi:hypothetical protein